jgi:hypothetical protein
MVTMNEDWIIIGSRGESFGYEELRAKVQTLVDQHEPPDSMPVDLMIETICEMIHRGTVGLCEHEDGQLHLVDMEHNHDEPGEIRLSMN